MERILLGRESAAPSTFGFDVHRPSAAGDLIAYEGEAPITVVAPTGSGKGRDFLIPLLLTHTGPVLVVDLKGELSAVTARRRRKMGHQVAVIDPFGITGKPSDRLDPFELFRLPGSIVECDAEMFAAMLNQGHGSDDDPFWDDTGSSLIAGLIALWSSMPNIGSSGLAFLRDQLFGDDAIYNIAVLLDMFGKVNEFGYREVAGFLQHPEKETRPCVLAVARTFLRSLTAPQVLACLENPTVTLMDVRDGAPLDIFLTIPPEKVISHAGLLRLIVGTLTTTILRRTEMPEQRTLMIVDEAAQLGREFAPLLTASTLMRGYGLQLVTAWQDLAQMKSRYKADWPTLLNNSGAVLTFGMGHWAAAKDAAEVLGWEPTDLLKLKPDEAVLAVRGEMTRKVRRLNYLKDAMFAGLADENPYHARRNKGVI